MKFVNILRYETTVRAQFFGHTHRDHFEVFYENDESYRPTAVAYVGPSVTPYYGMNIGYRVYTIDGDYEASSYVVLDHETHIVNLTQLNLSDRFEWLHEYSAKDAYDMKALLPADWDDLIKRMQKDDSLFMKFYRYV